MHVDGFRFDLASILGRDSRGEMLINPPLLESIAEDPILRHVKIIAEAWDAAGAYQVGSFPGKRWSEWNGRFRDDVRRFWRAERHSRNGLASRITGSSDIYTSSGKLPRNSINFLTCHDGLTLHDLVSYLGKHNEANGEANRDGDNNNLSVNFGVEGPSESPQVNSLRARQIRSLLTTLLLSRGVPMILAGDEFSRSQGGNNNAYCQDNEVSWLDWKLAGKNMHLVEFTRRLIALRKAHPVFRRNSFFTGQNRDHNGRADIQWYEATGTSVRWSDSRPCLACYLTGDGSTDWDFYLMFNSGRQRRAFHLPEPGTGKRWRPVLDAADENRLPELAESEPLSAQGLYDLKGHACALLAAY
jgi:isoamylase